MSALGTVALKLGLSDKEFKTQLDKSVNSVKKSVDSMKNILLAAQLGSILFSSAQNKMEENLTLVQIKLSALASGLSQSMIDALNPLVEQFDYIGIGADEASEAIYRFILQGKTMSLNSLGVYVDEDTKSMLAAMDATQRYEWALANLPGRLNDVMNQLDPTTKSMLEFQKKAKDVKETLGMTFLQTIMNIIDAFGGMTNAMRLALIAFASYKIATIVGNVAIGISKAIAQGGVFAAPVAIAMGAAALASVLAIGAGTGIAVNALNNIQEPGSTSGTDTTTNNSSSSGNQVVIVTNDRWGQVQQVVSNKNGGSSKNVQTNYSK